MKMHPFKLSHCHVSVTEKVTVNDFIINRLQRFRKCHTFFSYSPLYTAMYYIVVIYISIYYYVTNVTHTHLIENKTLVCHKPVTNLSQCVTMSVVTVERGTHTQADLRKEKNDKKHKQLTVWQLLMIHSFIGCGFLCFK